MKTKRILKTILILFFTWFFIHSIFITVDGLNDKTENADVAVVLGNKVNEDGSLSDRLKSRLNCGRELYEKGQIKGIIVSGGLGKEGFYEAEKMKEYLVLNSIPDSIIIVDNKGDNTIQTVKNTLGLQQKYNFKSIIVVSQFYHLTRTKMLFRKFGFNNISSVSPSYFEFRDFYSVFREFFAYYSEMFRS